MKKRIAAICAVCVMILMTAACAGGEKPLKIAIFTSPSTVDDGGFNQDIYKGITEYISAHKGSEVTEINIPEGSDVIEGVQTNIANYDVGVLCGYVFSNINSIASENGTKKFILIDSFPMDASGNEITAKNVYAVKYREAESGFYAGVAAALETKSGKVAIVNGIAYPSNVSFQRGFENGVLYANETYGAGAGYVELSAYAGIDQSGENAGGNYIGNFYDLIAGKTLGKELIDRGVDIIFACAGASGQGVFAAAAETENVMIIGCDADQYDLGAADGRNIVLTSAIKNMSKTVQEQLQSISEDSFTGGNFELGAEGDYTGFIGTEGRHQLSTGTQEKLAEVLTLIKSGEISPINAQK